MVASSVGRTIATAVARAVAGIGGGEPAIGYLTINGQQGSQAVDIDDAVTFAIVITDEPADFSPTYVWRRNGVALDPAETSSTLAITAAVANAGVYSVVISSGGEDYVLSISLNVNFGPVIDTQPSNQTVAVGADATLTVEVSGYPTPTGKWQRFVT